MPWAKTTGGNVTVRALASDTNDSRVVAVNARVWPANRECNLRQCNQRSERYR
jgi:hypothetical protein